MPPSGSECEGFVSVPASFATTHWSVVLTAGAGDSKQAAQALENLCAVYWYPLYAHVRRRGHDADAARDLTQGFFADVLSRNAFALADSSRGRFRTFLLGALDNFLHHSHRDAHALKRGGTNVMVSWDAQDGEERYKLEPQDDRSPDQEFDRRWALSTMERVRGKLRAELSVSGKEELFDLLRPHLFGDVAQVPYAEVAARLKMTTVAVKVTVHRWRRRYGELLRLEVAETLSDPTEVDQEIRHLIAALGT